MFSRVWNHKRVGAPSTSTVSRCIALGIVASIVTIAVLGSSRAGATVRPPSSQAPVGRSVSNEDPPPFYQPPGMVCWDFWYARVGETFYSYYLQAPIENQFQAPTIGLATSPDLVHWTPYGEVLRANPPGQWNDAWVATGSVWKQSKEWRMLFVGATYTGFRGMGMARSDDLLHWTRIGDGPVAFADHPFVVPDTRYWRDKGFTPGQELRYFVIADCYVLPEPIDGQYFMVANCLLADESLNKRGVVGLYKSWDGSSWESAGIIAAPRLYEQAEAPQVWKHGDRWFLIFGAANSEPLYRATMVYSSASLEGPFEPGPRPEIKLPDYNGWFYVAKVIPDAQGRDVLIGGVGGRMSWPYPVSYDADGSLSLAPYDPTPLPWRPEGLTNCIGGIVPDLAGGVIVDGRIRVSNDGYRMWVGPTTATGMTWVSDHSGGAVGVADAAGNVVSARTRLDGTMPWGSNVVVCDAPAWQGAPAIAPDGAGGALYAWMDGRDGPNHKIYVQRFDAQGNALWAANGVPACMAPGRQSGPAVVSDGEGGAIVAWDDERPGANGTRDIYAQRISAAGVPMWAQDGVPISAEAGIQEAPVIETDDLGGAYIAWWDARGDYRDIYMQRVGPDGRGAWDPDGNLIALGQYDQLLPALESDGDHGVFIAWEDHRIIGDQGLDILAQSVSPAGELRWPVPGVLVCTEPHRQMRPSVVADGLGGVFVAWLDARDGADQSPVLYAPYAQRFDRFGFKMWRTDGVRVQTAPGSPQNLIAASIVPDGTGGLFVGGSTGLQRVLADGRLAWTPAYIPRLDAVADVPDDQGGRVSITFREPVARGAGLTPAIQGYQVWRKVLGDDPPPNGWEVVVDNIPLGSPAITVVAPTRNDVTAADPAIETFCVSAITSISSVVLASGPLIVSSIDNLTPAAPRNLVGNRLGTRLDLVWSVGSEPDVAAYHVYRGTDPEFVPASDNRLATVEAPRWRHASVDPDSDYIYKVTTVDRHGNESVWAALASSQITELHLPGVSYFSHVAPNPMRHSTTIAYGLARASRVRLAVYDLAGRRVRLLVEGTIEAGDHSANWDARDAELRPVSPGVYLVHMTADGVVATRKLIVSD